MIKLNFLKGVGNVSFDASRILWLASVVSGIAYAGYHLVVHGAFSPIEFGTGMGLLLAGGGAATAVKDMGVAKADATTKAGEAAKE